jgi:hypothetical protein
MDGPYPYLRVRSTKDGLEDLTNKGMFALWPKLTNILVTAKTFLANVDDSHLFGMPMILDQSYLRFLPMLINLWVTKRLTKILASHGWGNHVIFLYLYHFLEPNKHPRIYCITENT